MTGKRLAVLLLTTVAGVTSLEAIANEVEIVGAYFEQAKNGTWSVNVALLHGDNGWHHYADIWRVVDAEGDILGERVLLHPHEDEQPFVRGTSGVEIPAGATVYVEAHDIVHGWTPNRLKVDMSKAVGGRLTLQSELTNK